MIIDRCQWSINKEVLEYWEGRGKKIVCYGESWEYEGKGYGSSIYFYELDVPQISIASLDENVIAHQKSNNIWRYQFGNHWYPEADIIKIIKLKAFI
jgi:hypothetical protein